MTAAQAGAAELELWLDTDTVRSALAYERGRFPRVAFMFAVAANVIMLVLIAGSRGVCKPGGILEPTPTTDCTWERTSWITQMSSFNIVLAIALNIAWIINAAEGGAIPRCSKPIYPLLSLLAASATVARPATRYTEAIELSQEVSRLGLPLRTFARKAAADFGNRCALRRELTTHLSRVDASFIEAADRLAADRTAAARKLAELGALAANNIAAGRFTTVLPTEALAEEASLEPDRLDGRRLATACLWAAALVTLAFLALSPLGAPVELLVPLAVVAFLILVYTLLAFRFGLSEATRLTRSISGFLSAGPPL